MISTSLQPSDSQLSFHGILQLLALKVIHHLYGEDCRRYRMALREICCVLILSLIAPSPVLKDANWIARLNAD
jgi:hypothetical protein